MLLLLLLLSLQIYVRGLIVLCHLLSHSCKDGSDPTLEYHYQDSSVQRLKLDAFRFWSKDGEAMVYFHCDVVACHKDDRESRCSKGCASSHDSSNSYTRKKPSSPQQHNNTLTIGPVKINVTRVKRDTKGKLFLKLSR